MFNHLSANFPSYIWFQTQNTLYHPYLFQNDSSFIMTPFMPIPSQNHNLEHQQSPQRLNMTDSSAVMMRKTAIDSSFASQSEQMPAKGLIIKEKIIKKSVNRPTSYITQRKFYLAQPCPDNQDSERKLRPRKIKKKRCQNTTFSPSKHEQEQIYSIGQKRNVEAVSKVNPLEKKEQELYSKSVNKKDEKSNHFTINEEQDVADVILM